MKNKMQLCWLLSVAFLVTATLSFGQAPTGSLAGTISDETGAVIANALVVIRNKATGAERRLIRSRRHLPRRLPPGRRI